MKTRGTRGGILLSLDASDKLDDVESIYNEHRDLFEGKVTLELAERVSYTLIKEIEAKVLDAGGELIDVKPPAAVTQVRGETVILSRTVRSGNSVESNGSIIIMGDVNAGAELIAEGDIIVIGALRGVAHAGASGNEKAVIWAQRILSPQLRIAGALAQSGGAQPEPTSPELAHLQDGQIVLKTWDK